MAYKKKLIEVALPLEAINAESAREKSIRHGHPSTLHLWWARRPLAAARAVIWSSLVDDPSSHPEQFPTKEEQDKERQRLFEILTDLVKWENSNDEKILSAAKAEIMKSTDNNPPALLDPFAGGGAIPLEAQRLGLKAYASDLNPVAVMINKAMIEIPPKFANMPPVNPDARTNSFKEGWKGAQGLAEDVRYYGEWMKQEAFKKIGHLYPKVKVPEEQGGGEATVIAWIWARTVKCPNPACGCEVPLIHSYALSKKKGKEKYIRPEYVNNNLRFNLEDRSIPGLPEGTINRKGAVCPNCGGAIEYTYIRNESCNGRMSSKLMAIVAEGEKGRLYILPDKNQVESAMVTKPQDYPEGELAYYPGHLNTKVYGLTEFNQLFTNRQLTALMTFSNLVSAAQKRATEDAVKAGMEDDETGIADGGKGATAYGEAVGVYLAFSVDKAANLWSSIVSWMNDRGAFRETFARQAIPMVWDYAEANPFSSAGGNFSMFIERSADTLSYLPNNSLAGIVMHKDAQSNPYLNNIMVSTDPPYYDNIGYADLSDFFYVWMRQALKNTYPKLFQTMLVPKREELIATPYRFDGSIEKARDFFEDGMKKTFINVHSYASDDVPVTIYYAFKQSESDEDNEGEQKTASTGWETMLSAIIQSGFTITGTWPVRTESPGRSISQGTNALASSIVLVCRKRSQDAAICTRRDFINALHRELKPALDELQNSNIAPVDLAQSAIGPGMSVYSRYSKVLEADGTPMGVRSALQIINQELDLYFTEQEGYLDRDSRFCVDLYTQCAFNEIKFGEADVLARAKNTSTAQLAEEGALHSSKGIVRLLTREEITDKVDQKKDFIWLLTQQLTKAMETGGILACAKMIAPIFGSKPDNAKALAYRLFTIADRKGWTAEAFAYNALVCAWGDIQSKAAELQNAEPAQLSLFDKI